MTTIYLTINNTPRTLPVPPMTSLLASTLLCTTLTACRGVPTPNPITSRTSQPTVYAFPTVRPGETCDQARMLLGKESSADGYSLSWKQRDKEITITRDSGCIVNGVLYSAIPGQTFTTPEGIIVGRDTLTEAMEKLKSVAAHTSPFVSEPEGQVIAEIEIPPTPQSPFKKIYSWYLTPRIAEKLGRAPQISDFAGEPTGSYSVDLIPVHEPGEVPID